jgi:hypothetical protein
MGAFASRAGLVEVSGVFPAIGAEPRPTDEAVAVLSTAPDAGPGAGADGGLDAGVDSGLDAGAEVAAAAVNF